MEAIDERYVNVSMSLSSLAKSSSSQSSHDKRSSDRRIGVHHVQYHVHACFGTYEMGGGNGTLWARNGGRNVP